MNDKKNGALHAEYKKLDEVENKLIFDGHLGEYKYYNTTQIIAAVLEMYEVELV